MNLIEKQKGVQFLGNFNGNAVLRFPNCLIVGKTEINIVKNDDFAVHDNTVLFGKKNGEEVVYVDNKFVPWPPCRYSERVMLSLKNSQCYIDGFSKLSLFVNNEELLFNIKSDAQLRFFKYVECYGQEVVVFMSDMFKKLFFYTKEGEKLWEFHVVDLDVKIDMKSLLVVGNVMIICCNRGLRKHSVEGFDIHTGEKLWGYYGEDVRCGRNYMAADDGMVYGIYMRESEKDREKVLLCVEKIEPISGVSNLYIVKEDTRDLEVYQWLATISDMKLYYSDDRPGCSIGVVDLKTMSLIDDCHLQLKKAGSYGLEKPIVIGDKVYAYSRETEELFVFEK